jgi:hypothetical protein
MTAITEKAEPNKLNKIRQPNEQPKLNKLTSNKAETKVMGNHKL